MRINQKIITCVVLRVNLEYMIEPCDTRRMTIRTLLEMG